MQARYNMMVGVDPFMEVVDGQEEFTPAVEIDESLFTHFDLGDGDDIHARQCWVLGFYDLTSDFTILIAIGNGRDA